MQQNEYTQELINTILHYLAEHYDNSRLYEMLHHEMGTTHDDIELLGFDLSQCYEQEQTERSRTEHTAWTSSKTADLVATCEELLQVPREECITHYFGDYGGHFFHNGVTEEQIAAAYEKALAIMGLDSETFQADDSYIYRGEIISRMRARLLADELHLDETVLFVNTEPHGGPVDFGLGGGIVKAIDRERLTCSVRGEFFTMEHVPLHYVMGRYDKNAPGTHYGFQHVVPLFGENPALADHYIREAEEHWNALLSDEQGLSPSMTM